jgi:hypothetical protein
LGLSLGSKSIGFASPKHFGYTATGNLQNSLRPIAPVFPARKLPKTTECTCGCLINNLVVASSQSSLMTSCGKSIETSQAIRWKPQSSEQCTNFLLSQSLCGMRTVHLYYCLSAIASWVSFHEKDSFSSDTNYNDPQIQTIDNESQIRC